MSKNEMKTDFLPHLPTIFSHSFSRISHSVGLFHFTAITFWLVPNVIQITITFSRVYITFSIQRYQPNFHLMSSHSTFGICLVLIEKFLFFVLYYVEKYSRQTTMLHRAHSSFRLENLNILFAICNISSHSPILAVGLMIYSREFFLCVLSFMKC